MSCEAGRHEPRGDDSRRTLKLSLALTVDAICERFENAWRAGRTPRIEDYLHTDATIAGSTSATRALLVELVMIDLAYRWRAPAATGNADSTSESAATTPEGGAASYADPLTSRPDLRHYVDRYRQLGPLDSLPLQLIAAEYRARRLAGDMPDITYYTSIFHHDESELRDLFDRIDREISGQRGPGGQPGADGRWRPPSSAEMFYRCPDCGEASPFRAYCRDGLIDCPMCCDAGETRLVERGDEGVRVGASLLHFRLLQELGSGAFATVWKAFDTRLHRTVAIKIPHSEYLTAEEVRAFVREAQAASQIHHAGIVSVHQVGWHDNRAFLVSQWIDGQSLKVWLRQHTVSPEQAATLIQKIAVALQALHDAGIIHRDIKPSNILMDVHGNPHITDFGLAKRSSRADGSTDHARVLGTPAYMAPEQARGDSHLADQRTDVYSLGVVLYGLLTGRTPFGGSNEAMIAAIMRDEPVRPRRYNGAVPRDLELICLKCLHKDPGHRYPTARALSDDLGRFLSGRPITARPIGWIHRTTRWCRRNPIYAVLVAAIAVLLFGMIAVTQIGYYRATSLLRRAEANLYFAEIGTARRYWLENYPRRCLSVLHDCPRELRDWEWQYLHGLCEASAIQLRPGGGDVAFSPDGKYVAIAGGPRRELRLWDAHTGSDLGRFPDSLGRMGLIAFSRDGRRIAGSNILDGTVRIWDVASRRGVAVLHCSRDPLVQLTFTPDDRRIVTISGKRRHISIWRAADGKRIETLPITTSGEILGAALSPGGNRLALGLRNGRILIVDLSTGQQVTCFTASAGRIRTVAWHPLGRQLAAEDSLGALRAWDVEQQRVAVTYTTGGADSARVVYSNDGNRIACGMWNNTVNVWDTATGQLVGTSRGHRAAILGLAFSRDDRWLVAGSRDDEALIWDTGTEQGCVTLQCGTGPIRALAFDSDNRTVAVLANDGRIRLWDIATGHALVTGRSADSAARALAFGPQGHLLAIAGSDGTIAICNMRDGGRTDTLTATTGSVRLVAFRADSRVLVSADSTGTICFWDLSKRALMRKIATGYRDHRAVAFNPDGQSVAFASRRGCVTIWDIERGTCLRTLSTKDMPLGSVAYSPDGRLIGAGAADGGFRIWDSRTGRLLHLFAGGLRQRTVGFAWSPRGSRFVTAVSGRGVDLWDAATARPVMTIHADGRESGAVAFSPDGTCIAAGTTDGRVLVWASRPLQSLPVE